MSSIRTFAALSVLFGVVWLIPHAQAAAPETRSETKPTEQSTQIAPPAAPVVAPVPTHPQLEQDRRRQDVLKRLNGTQWVLELISRTASGKVKTQRDTVKFEGGQVSSEQLLEAGYAPTNYTVTVGDDGVPVWETMQTNEKQDVVFWRGELRDSVMRGLLSKHPAEGPTEDLSFVGNQAGGQVRESDAPAAAAQAPSAETAPPAASDSAPAPAKSTKKKRR